LSDCILLYFHDVLGTSFWERRNIRVSCSILVWVRESGIHWVLVNSIQARGITGKMSYCCNKASTRRSQLLGFFLLHDHRI